MARAFEKVVEWWSRDLDAMLFSGDDATMQVLSPMVLVNKLLAPAYPPLLVAVDEISNSSVRCRG